MNAWLEPSDAARRRRGIWLGIVVFCALPVPGIILTPKAAIVAIAFLIGVLCLVLDLLFQPAAPRTMVGAAQDRIEESTPTALRR